MQISSDATANCGPIWIPKEEREENNGGEINYCSLRIPRTSQDVVDPDGPTATGPAPTQKAQRRLPRD